LWRRVSRSHIPAILDGTRSQNFTYDQLNRIKTAQTQSTTGGNCWGLSFTYDNWANLTAAAVTQCSAPMLSIGVDTKNRITAGFSYDLAGNSGFGSPVDSTGVRTPDVTADGSFSYAWNAESEMKTAAGVTYAYDGLGNRVSKSNGKLYWYGPEASGGSAVLDESDLNGNITSEHVYFGGQRVARRDASSNVYYYVEDMLGTSRALTTSNGTVCYDADFYPFGGERTPVVNTCPQNFKFNGKERDPETGLDDFGARYFSSSSGRWLSPDWSAIPAPVPYANLSNPQTLNLYQFVGDNPETFADLDGHEGIMAMSGRPPDHCEINACSESETLFGDRGTAGDGIATPTIAAPMFWGDSAPASQGYGWINGVYYPPQNPAQGNPGVPVVLPNGSNVPDSHSPTGKLMSPVANLSPVAAAGSKTLDHYLALLAVDRTVAEAYLMASLGKNVGTGGTFDYQRSGNVITGFKQLPQFRDVSNFNVGLFAQKAGLSLGRTLTIAGRCANLFSSNANSKQPYGLAPRTAEFIRRGYSAGATVY
jgi:RHS repeat-associated protein